MTWNWLQKCVWHYNNRDSTSETSEKSRTTLKLARTKCRKPKSYRESCKRWTGRVCFVLKRNECPLAAKSLFVGLVELTAGGTLLCAPSTHGLTWSGSCLSASSCLPFTDAPPISLSLSQLRQLGDKQQESIDPHWVTILARRMCSFWG